MKKPLHPVTLPILIDAETPERATGESVTFPNATRTRFVKVRDITAVEIKRRILEIFSSEKDSPNNEKFLYVGAGLLSKAFAEKDEWKIRDALRMMHPWIPGFGTKTLNRGDAWAGARWVFSSVMSNTVQTARLVSWYQYQSERLLSPAVYCPNLMTAAFVMMSMGGIRVCPKCHSPFIPERDNQDYCKPSHGVAYRTARSRRRKKHKGKECKK